MKKNFKLVLALVLSIMMVLGSVAAMADDNTVTNPVATNKNAGALSITMTGAEDGHTFKAYKIFDGSLSADGKMGDISWDPDVTLTAIAPGTTTIYDELNAIEGLTLASNDIAGVVAAIDSLNDDVDILKKVADVIYARKPSTADGTATAKSEGTDNYVISPLQVGYYLVTDEYTTAPAANAGAATLSRNILAVVGNVTAAVKNTKPEIDKQVLRDNGEWKDTNDAGIGETVAFKITSKVPNYAGYKNYFFVINDTLSNGLTFDGSDTIKVTVGGTELTANTDYVVYSSDDPENSGYADGKTFQIAFKHIMNYTVGDNIVVTYTATVNSNAVIGESGNDNTVDLIYSNNPNDSGDGNPEDNPKPDEDHPTGTTPEAKTITYVAELDLTKYKDSIGTGNELAGAQFTLTGTSTWVKGVGADVYEEAEGLTGSYYLLKDGTYTTSKPHGDITDSAGVLKVASNEADYEYTDKTYKLTKKTTYTTETQKVFMQGTSDANGKIVFKGLGAGTYTLTETITPQGYTTAAPITVTFTVSLPDTITTGNEKAQWSSDNATVTMKNGTATTGVYETNVVDLSGATLPSTGGIGTTIFYVAGSVLVLAAAILLITKRRMGAND